MRVQILLPSKVFLDTEAHKVKAEAENGEFCLLPRHVDFVAALVPGILSVIGEGGNEEFFAVDRGILVKQGKRVLISVEKAIRGPNLGELRRRVRDEFEVLEEHEKEARTAAAKLEAAFVKRFIEVG